MKRRKHYTLSAVPLSAGKPRLGAPALAQRHGFTIGHRTLSAASLTSGRPTFDDWREPLAVPPTPSRSVSEADLKRCGEQIKKNWPTDKAPPTEAQFLEIVEGKFGRHIERERARALRRDLRWNRTVGRPRKNSPK
jgi:hypothetical protein